MISLFAAHPAHAQSDGSDAIVIILDGASLPDLLAVDELRAVATDGGVALMNGRSDVRQTFPDTFFPNRAVGRLPFTYVDLGTTQPSEAGRRVTEELRTVAAPALLLIISVAPSAASAADGDELGTVIAAWGDPSELLTAEGRPHALTSDSTRRPGVVADVDPAATVAEWLDLPYDAGAPIERIGEPAPFDLYERYLQQRRLAVPAAAASWGLMLVFGLAGILALAFRRRVSPGTLALTGELAGSLPWLALGLLMVGHLPSLTVATVVPFLVAVMVAGVVFDRWVEGRRGIFVALAACGGVILGILAIEAALGWPAAVTPLAGGGQLDGGRFFGMPNVEIGIVLGAAMFAAHRLRVGTGVLLLAACAVVAGSPWTGSNFGAAITLFAAAGLWLGIRRRRPWWVIVVITGAITAVGMAAIAVMHRYLTERPTHITAFLEHTSSLSGVLDRLTGRLGIGFDQLTDTPLAAVPVVGTLVLLFLVLRPPAAIARSFEGHDAWRDAVLVILLASIVAYLANDTGAAAVGFGFGFALAGLIEVSLATARRMMAR
jgi:MYXO-CTERM domain-containing protein